MATRGRKLNRDWLSNPDGELPSIASPLYLDQHFIWELQDIPTGSDTPRLCLITCTHCDDYSEKVPAVKYNSTGNLMIHIRSKHPKIAKEIEEKEAQKKTP